MDAAPAEPSARAGHCCQPHSELQGDGKRAQGTEMSSFPPLLSASGMKLPREGVLPTTCCFLPPTRVCFWPSSTSPCRKSRLWFPWKRHLRGPPPKVGNTVGLARQRWSHVSCYSIPRVLLPHPQLGNLLLVSTKAFLTTSHGSHQGSPGVRQPSLEGGLLLPEKRVALTSLL